MFCRKGVLRNFAKFTGKHLCQSLFLNKVSGLNFFFIPGKNLLEKTGNNTQIEWQTLKPDTYMKFSKFYYVASPLNPIFQMKSTEIHELNKWL